MTYVREIEIYNLSSLFDLMQTMSEGFTEQSDLTQFITQKTKSILNSHSKFGTLMIAFKQLFPISMLKEEETKLNLDSYSLDENFDSNLLIQIFDNVTKEKKMG
ncbi:hypothetical protein TNIN_412191 [Trichonephila inaurata madagascariensis]|uniref:Uncharacterized protein n=1 Tax=Trichonephila inaurata madagascariensis TaxID=2747483 RepID=A0A8X6M721_9ARAC|nr:hypothetical protein TNIN_412191 [Trichonephila inaurata madagascariensis]